MHGIDLTGAAFVFYLLVFVPWMSLRSGRVLRAPAGSPLAQRMPSLTFVFANTIVALGLLFALTWFTARTFSFNPFALAPLSGAKVVAAFVALLFQCAMLYVNIATRSAEEVRAMPANRLAPHAPVEKALYAVCSILAGVVEEAAYRGVLMALLWYALGSVWAAVFISAAGFAIGHALQGWKSMVVIFVMACSMHLLVWYTGTLILAMAVHALYDLLAPTLRRRISRELPRDPERIAG